MSEEKNIQTVRKVFQAINDHELGKYPELYTKDYKAEQPGAGKPMDLAQNDAYLQRFIDAFPDLHFDLVDVIASGDYVVVNWRGIGTQDGPLTTPTGDQIPPTNKRVVVDGSLTYKFQGDQIAESKAYWDMVSMLTQLGIMEMASR